MNKVVVLTVCVVTFNHEEFIEECLQSLVDQKTNFIFNVIVSDDNSTDRTPEIIIDFQRKYPDIIFPIFREKNIGPVLNYFDVHSKATGKFVAHLDGDDYALPGKLQKQVDYLERNPTVNVLWHRMVMFDGCTMIDHPKLGSPYCNKQLRLSDILLYGPTGAHSSTMYRRTNYSIRYKNFATLDWILNVELMGTGCSLMLEDVLGVYRLHSNGMSSGAKANKYTRMLFANCQLELLKRYPEYSKQIGTSALFNAFFDAIKFKSYFITSIMVFINSKSLPSFFYIYKLIRFKRYSKLPRCFN